MTSVSRHFDPIFKAHRGRLPVAFLRALGQRESGLNPSDARDPAWGLMQVVPQVRVSFNDRYGASYSQQDLLDPAVNVKIASELLNRIASQYDALHGAASPNLRENWNNPEFVKLVVAGWNSGYSEAGGVGRVAKYLESRAIPVTHDNVFRYAGQAGATPHLQTDQRYQWQRSVAALFYDEGGPGLLEGGASLALVLAGVAAGAYFLLKDD